MIKSLAVISMLVLCLSSQALSPHAVKWGKHKKQQPLFIPEAPFPIDMPDLLGERVRKYLHKKQTDLLDGQQKFPGLKVQIQELLEDITALDALSVADPEFVQKFGEFHTALLFLWNMEVYSAT